MILNATLCHHTPSVHPLTRQRQNTLISLNRIVLHHQLTLLSSPSRKNDIVTVLHIVTQVIYRVRIEKRINEVDSEVKILLVLKQLIYFALRSTRVHKIRRVSTSTHSHKHSLGCLRRVFTINLKRRVQRQT